MVKRQEGYKIEAIILNSRKVREYDRIYSIFSKEKGKMNVIGIGARKPQAKLASGLEPLTLSELFLIKCRGLDRVAGVLIDRQYIEIKNELEDLVDAKKTAKIIGDILPESEPSEEVFEAFGFYLERLNERKQLKSEEKKVILGQKVQLKLLQLAVIWKCIKWCGHEPQTYRCIQCGTTLKDKGGEKYVFSVPQGVVCDECQRGLSNEIVRISQEVIKILRIFTTQKIIIIDKVRVTNRTIRELEQVTRLMLGNITNRKTFL